MQHDWRSHVRVMLPEPRQWQAPPEDVFFGRGKNDLQRLRSAPCFFVCLVRAVVMLLLAVRDGNVACSRV